jgi:prephenate dehydrogenase
MNKSVDLLLDSHITIVGLGLMGGSLALALKDKCSGITAVEVDEHARHIGLERGLVNHVTKNLEDGLKHADILVLATPVRAILETLEKLNRLSYHTNRTLLVLDLGSTKAEVASAMALLPKTFSGIGGHPMCGKETSGLEYADASLYKDAVFVLTPQSNTDKKMLGLARQIISAIGSIPIEMDAEKHDKLAALTSHLPYLLACSLVLTVSSEGDVDPIVWKMVSSGFKDTTRVASSDVQMLIDILETNKASIKNALGEQRIAMDKLEIALDGDLESLQDYLSSIQDIRNHHFPVAPSDSS